MRDRAVNRNDHSLVDPLDEPRRSASHPVVGFLVLIAVDERLFEETELVVDAVAETWIVEGRQRIQEAGRQAAETAVPERGIGLEIDDVVDVFTELREDAASLVIESEVRESVAERPSHEELHGEVVDTLGILLQIAAIAFPHGVEH